MSEYYCLYLECMIYIRHKNNHLYITVPAYDIYDREPAMFYVSNFDFKFMYYKYILEYDSFNSQFISIYDRESSHKKDVKLERISEKEYQKMSEKVDRKKILLEEYACTKKNQFYFYIKKFHLTL